ncbi:MAG: Methylated-DNA-(protein)-cysteine S-methyltransferase binding protein [Frankiales bacterium]|nr:Methylated-DNA-(protein)-cysteine S-methyltransferase binding protein [Frankiales bacterium]
MPNLRAASVSAGLSTRPGTSGGGEPTAYARTVLDVVATIPRGRVMTYGDVAEYLGSGSGRTVGTVMSRYGSEVPWWRVVRANGEPHADALQRLADEGCPVTAERVQLASCRWDGREVRRTRP